MAIGLLIVGLAFAILRMMSFGVIDDRICVAAGVFVLAVCVGAIAAASQREGSHLLVHRPRGPQAMRAEIRTRSFNGVRKSSRPTTFAAQPPVSSSAPVRMEVWSKHPRGVRTDTARSVRYWLVAAPSAAICTNLCGHLVALIGWIDPNDTLLVTVLALPAALVTAARFAPAAQCD
ncbi:MAG: hypothetical protein ABGW87_12260 [Sphingomonadaceae bacterium]